MTFTLRTNVAGTYTISAEVCATSGDGVTCDGDWSRARNDGASIVVAPGVPAPGRSVVECGGSIASAVNAPAVCAVTLADSHGNKIIRRDERSVPPTIIARLDPPDGYEPSDPFVGSEPCAVSSEPDGTYVVTCVPTVAGSRALRVYLDPSDVDSPVSNELIGGDAYSIAVTHGAFSADKSTIIPPVKHPAGNALVVKVAARDGRGNAYSGLDLSFTATLKKFFKKSATKTRSRPPWRLPPARRPTMKDGSLSSSQRAPPPSPGSIPSTCSNHRAARGSDRERV